MAPNPSPIESLIAGSIAGIASVVAFHPLDVIRTQIQVMSSNGVKHSICSTIEKGDFRALYRGIAGPLFAQSVYKAVIFSVNNIIGSYVFPGEKSHAAHFISGTFAGAINSFFVAPIELVRTRLIIDRSSNFTSTLHVLRNEAGLFGFWRSVIPTICRDGPGVGAYLLTFETCKRVISSQVYSSSDMSTWIKIASGSCAGVAFWTFALPFDTIKAVMEAGGHRRYGPIQQLVSMAQIINERSMWSLFRAWPVAFGRGIPSAAVTLTTYDLVSERLMRIRSTR